MRGEYSIQIDATPQQVYDAVSDLTRMGEYSPECRSVEWLDGAAGPLPGARFMGHNRGGPFTWSRRGRVISAEPAREFSFVTEEGGREGTLWTYRLRPVGQGTQVTESYEVRWIPWWMHLVDVITLRRQQLGRNMTKTLVRLKARVESSTSPSRA
jgi:uncharacterized protein YndB with AHSA1/START domain